MNIPWQLHPIDHSRPAFCNECHQYIPNPTIQGPHPNDPQQPLYLCADCNGDTAKLMIEATYKKQYPQEHTNIQYHGENAPH